MDDEEWHSQLSCSLHLMTYSGPQSTTVSQTLPGALSRSVTLQVNILYTVWQTGGGGFVG